MDSSRRYIGIEVPNWMYGIQLTKREESAMHATTVAVDLAKEIFELAFADADHHIVQRKRLSRRLFCRALENHTPARVVMEACSSAHYWARRFVRQGHTVRLLPARDVRPYVRRNKTDRTDAAVCSKPIAVRRSTQCRLNHPINKVCRRCTASATNSKRNARPPSISFVACCANSVS
jgi:DNA-binding transcriptional LysR family regulator